jgi:NTP pyrophosphatase (non-canonical NTP hydrolase)
MDALRAANTSAGNDRDFRPLAQPLIDVKLQAAHRIARMGQNAVRDRRPANDIAFFIEGPGPERGSSPVDADKDRAVFHERRPVIRSRVVEITGRMLSRLLHRRESQSIPVCVTCDRKPQKSFTAQTVSIRTRVMDHSDTSRHQRAADEFVRLLEIMDRLRDPDGGCPWDLEQTFHTIAPYTIEEAYEVADAIERGDKGELREELGDLLFQVAFHSRMAAEEGAFEAADVAAAINEKMIRRHPHVFEASR